MIPFEFPEPSKSEPWRPFARWYGGKWNLAKWIISFMPPHARYVEPFAGAASVLMRKKPTRTDIINDLDCQLVEAFEMVRDQIQWPHLAFNLIMTPFARDEFERSLEPSDDPLERVRRFFVRQAFAMSTDRRDGGTNRTGFRSYSDEARTAPMKDWKTFVDALGSCRMRLQHVIIENRDAFEVMEKHDGMTTLHFVDPPYRMDTRRSTKRGYQHELDEDDHDRLLAFLCTLKGMVILSGYPSPAYDAALPGWERHERLAQDLTGAKRTECVWLNPALQRTRAAEKAAAEAAAAKKAETEAEDQANAAKAAAREQAKVAKAAAAEMKRLAKAAQGNLFA